MKFALPAIVIGILGTLAGCGGSSTTPTATPSVTAVTVSGTAPGVGASVQFSATATLSNGTTQAATAQATWSSSNSSVASVTSAGVVTGVAAGEADITATYQSQTGRVHATIVSAGSLVFTLSGTVTDATSGGVLPNISIQVTDSAGASRSTVSGSTGTFSIGGLPAGSATLTASAISYQNTTRTVAISADIRADISLPRVICTLTVSPASFSIATSGGTGSVTVTSPATGCAWQAKSNDAFITVTSGSAGTDAGTVAFSVAANTGAARSGTLTVAGTTVTVTQAAPVMVMAVYDPTFKTPVCNDIGLGCDSGTLLSGSGSTEPNQPNTIFNSCADGTGSLAVVSTVRVFTVDGSAMAPGKTITIEVVYHGSSADSIYIYIAADARNPVWTRVRSDSASQGSFRLQTVLPEGALEAVRVINLFGNAVDPGPCGISQNVDVDDVVFRIR